MEFVLVLRATEDWLQLDLEEYLNLHLARPFVDRRNNCENNLRDNLEQWHKLSVNFFEYRHQLKQIAMDKWTLPWITTEQAVEIKDPNVIFIPIDDDDMVHPRLADYIRPLYKNNITSVNWGCWYFSIISKHWPLIRDVDVGKEVPRRDIVSSNCYSFRSTTATEEHIMYHDKYTDRGDYPKLNIPEWLGLRLFHPGNTQFLYHTQNKLNADIICIDRIGIPPKVEWGRRYMEEIWDFAATAFAEILDKRA